MRLVLDTNIWFDWLIFGEPDIAPLQSTVAAGRAQIIINAACEEELIRVLAYPLQRWTIDAEQQAACLEQCRGIATMVDISCAAALPRCADPDDQKFLELASAAKAGWLITRDRELLALARHHARLGFHIVTPAEFASRAA